MNRRLGVQAINAYFAALEEGSNLEGVRDHSSGIFRNFDGSFSSPAFVEHHIRSELNLAFPDRNYLLGYFDMKRILLGVSNLEDSDE